MPSPCTILLRSQYLACVTSGADNPDNISWHRCMPTRPDQLSKEQVLRWASRREQVGGRIRELRLEQGLSQEALALEAGLSRNMIIGIEWGRKSLAYERLWDIAAVLGCDVAEFLVSADRPPSTSPYRGGRRAMKSSDKHLGG
ncbi:helix-turn-helix domain-containing protein [Paenarthrobacter sp. NPDC058233]|uniref:helix-turn-helix domain-containing protein n=2 Tax=unclassified Paenarthrobacter TaxID=2634190 RepID=UPI0036DB9058